MLKICYMKTYIFNNDMIVSMAILLNKSTMSMFFLYRNVSLLTGVGLLSVQTNIQIVLIFLCKILVYSNNLLINLRLYTI